MTREDITKVLAYISVAYPTFKVVDKSATVSIWQEMVGEWPLEIVMSAVKGYIATDTSGFAPAIGTILQLCREITTDKGLSESEAWTLVEIASRNSTYNSIKEFEKLPDEVKEAVGSPTYLQELARTDFATLNTVTEPMFRKRYRAIVERKQKISQMPKEVQALIDQTVTKLEVPQIEHKPSERERLEGIDSVPAPMDWRNRI